MVMAERILWSEVLKLALWDFCHGGAEQSTGPRYYEDAVREVVLEIARKRVRR